MSCLGIALLLLGVVAVVRSVTATIVSMLFFGWLLVFASGVEIAQAVMVGHWAAAEHHQNGSAFHADPRASGDRLRRHLRHLSICEETISDDGFIFTPDLTSAGLTCRLVPPLSKEARFCLGERIGFSIHAFEREVTRVPTEVASLDRRVALPTINSGAKSRRITFLVPADEMIERMSETPRGNYWSGQDRNSVLCKKMQVTGTDRG